MEWYTTQSTVRPETLDVTSSRVYNYLRRNIEETEVEGVVFYTYDEMKVKKDDLGKQTNCRNKDMGTGAAIEKTRSQGCVKRASRRRGNHATALPRDYGRAIQ